MKDSGEQFVMIPGMNSMQQWCVHNLDTMDQVRMCVCVCVCVCVCMCVCVCVCVCVFEKEKYSIGWKTCPHSREWPKYF